jgi:hypothetical protein
MFGFGRKLARYSRTSTSILSALLLLSSFATLGVAFGQTFPTAANSLDLQIGGGFTTATSDYATGHINGYLVLGGLRLRDHLREETELRHYTNSKNSLSETSVLSGISYSMTFRGISPYIKGLAGAGFLKNPNATGVLVRAVSGGLDLTLNPSVHLRADYEYQSWPPELGFEQGLVVKMFTVGGVYHLHPFDSPRQY